MKKTLRNLFLSLILLVSALVLFPPPAHADSYRVTNYKELQEALKNASWYSWELEPNADFGWPSEPTTVNLKAGMYDYIGITGTWNIPSNVTIIQSSPMYNSGQINLSGTWKSSKYNPAPMVIKNRGKLIVEETDSYSFPITVENGGTIDLDRNWLVLTDKTTLTLKKGAKVNGTGKICMCDATIASDGATLTAELCASGYSSYGDSTKKPKNQIKGKLTVTNLNFNDDQHLYVTSGSTLTIGGRISNYDTKSSLTVENGGRLVTMDYVECPVNLIINDGGNFDIKGYFSLQKGHNIRIRKSGTITAYKSVTLENATRLTIDAAWQIQSILRQLTGFY